MKLDIKYIENFKSESTRKELLELHKTLLKELKQLKDNFDKLCIDKSESLNKYKEILSNEFNIIDKQYQELTKNTKMIKEFETKEQDIKKLQNSYGEKLAIVEDKASKYDALNKKRQEKLNEFYKLNSN